VLKTLKHTPLHASLGMGVAQSKRVLCVNAGVECFALLFRTREFAGSNLDQETGFTH
jgi:hypothetical protein